MSATGDNAEQVLDSILPVVRRRRLFFKVVRNVDLFRRLNQGEFGLGQIGKFVTVYPTENGDVLSSIALDLDSATADFRSTHIETDMRLRQYSSVSYRYGAFIPKLLQDADGRPRTMLVAPDGSEYEDQRDSPYQAPANRLDPFEQRGLGYSHLRLPPLIAERYLEADLIGSTARGQTYAGVDLEGRSLCVIKRAKRDSWIGPDGLDSIDLLNHEAEALSALECVAPRLFFYENHKGGDDAVLVQEHVGGVCLNKAFFMLPPTGEDLARVLARDLIRQLEEIHDLGWAHRDLTPGNVIRCADGGLRLIDFGLAAKFGSRSAAWGRGTEGFASPEQRAGAPPSASDDVFALAATIFRQAYATDYETAVEAWRRGLLPDGADIRLLVRCVTTNRQDRPKLLDLEKQFRQDPTIRQVVVENDAFERRGDTGASATGRFRAQPGELLDAMGGDDFTSPFHSLDVAIGRAGQLLVMFDEARAATVQSKKSIREIRTLARHILKEESRKDHFISGLYFGRAGIATSALAAGRLLNDYQIIEDALELLDTCGSVDPNQVDVYTGWAGIARANLRAWECTTERRFIKRAEAICRGPVAAKARAMIDIATAEESEPLLGYAHGLAGIADVLLEVGVATGDEASIQLAQRAGEYLVRNSESDICGNIYWPVRSTGEPVPAHWCHGSTGIGWLFCSLDSVFPSGPWTSVVDNCVGAARLAVRDQEVSLCHGIGSSLELQLIHLSLANHEFCFDWSSEGQSWLALQVGSLEQILRVPVDEVGKHFMIDALGVRSLLIRQNSQMHSILQSSVLLASPVLRHV